MNSFKAEDKQAESFTPADYQTTYKPGDFIIQTEAGPGTDSLQVDVLFVGAGPASLTGAIRLADLAKAKGREIQIGRYGKGRKPWRAQPFRGGLSTPWFFNGFSLTNRLRSFPLEKRSPKSLFFTSARDIAGLFPFLPA